MRNEIRALRTAIEQFPELAELVDGISVGSEDLYRISPLDPVKELGAGPDILARYINEVKDTLGDVGFEAPVGHVDTWTAWVNASNEAVVEASDFIGFDAYPYFQNTMNNPISEAKKLFNEALEKTEAVSKGKPIWITETGWPVSGPNQNRARANTRDAKTYWDEVGCNQLFGNVNVWWYTLQDASPTTPSPSFGVLGSDLNSEPLYDLSCKASSSSSSASASASATESSSGSEGSSTKTKTNTKSTDSSHATTTGGAYPTGGAPYPTGGPTVSSNATSTFAASTVVPSAPSDNTSSPVPTGAAVAKAASVAGALGGVLAMLFL
jgi:glucan endo-1,3-beta-D-glucosidase